MALHVFFYNMIFEWLRLSSRSIYLRPSLVIFFYANLTNNHYYLLEDLFLNNSMFTILTNWAISWPGKTAYRFSLSLPKISFFYFAFLLATVSQACREREGGIRVCSDLKRISWRGCSDPVSELIVLSFVWCVSPGVILNPSYHININVPYHIAPWVLAIVHQRDHLGPSQGHNSLSTVTSLPSGEGFREGEPEGWDAQGGGFTPLINAVPYKKVSLRELSATPFVGRQDWRRALLNASGKSRLIDIFAKLPS